VPRGGIGRKKIRSAPHLVQGIVQFDQHRLQLNPREGKRRTGKKRKREESGSSLHTDFSLGRAEKEREMKETLPVLVRYNTSRLSAAIGDHGRRKKKATEKEGKIGLLIVRPVT